MLLHLHGATADPVRIAAAFVLNSQQAKERRFGR
jgi:hypothetical protein